MDMSVMRTPVPPSDFIEVPLKGYKQRYKLKATICHSGKNATWGHYWSRLIFDNVKVKADDCNISVDSKDDVDRAGVIHLYEICNDMATWQHKNKNTPAPDVVDVTESLPKEPVDIAVPWLNFWTRTSTSRNVMKGYREQTDCSPYQSSERHSTNCAK